MASLRSPTAAFHGSAGVFPRRPDMWDMDDAPEFEAGRGVIRSPAETLGAKRGK